MKEGTGGDPFGDESLDDQSTDDQSTDDQSTDDTLGQDDRATENASVSTSGTTSDSSSTPKEDETGRDEAGLPWAVQRNSVKSDREMVQFYLREFVQERESDFKRDVEAETGYDTYLTDVREAAYLVAMDHPDEVADLLDEWGCEYG